MTRRIPQIALLVVALGFLAWAITRGLERLAAPAPAPAAANGTSAPATAHITATLFYGAPDGQSLVAVRREVPLAEDVVAQGRAIVAAQLQEPAPEGALSVVPAGTRLLAFYVTDRGDAFVDIDSTISRGHPGGSFTEMLTVYAIVNAVTANLPSIERVQLLIDGKEVDTLAGHVDIRRPLQRDDTLVVMP